MIASTTRRLRAPYTDVDKLNCNLNDRIMPRCYRLL